MKPFDANDPAIDLSFVDAATQAVRIEATGRDVGLMAGRTGPEVDADEIMPDWVALLATAVSLGMLSGGAAPWMSRAVVTANDYDAVRSRNVWDVTLEHVDPGFALVLLNLLRARQLDTVAIRTVRAPEDARPIDVGQLGYPGRYPDLPFLMWEEEPTRRSKDRRLEIIFERPPTDAESEAALTALRVWGDLLILAAYAIDDRHPRQAYTLPDIPYWTNETTLAQPFEEFFDSDNVCVNAMVNWAVRSHHAGMHVRTVHTR